MNKSMVLLIIAVAASLIGTMVFAEKPSVKNKGESDFMEHCAMCHPDGGNIMNDKKTLRKKDLASNNIKTVADIIKIMRKPGPGMTAFDEKTISNAEAKKIARYILKAFSR